MKKKRIIAVANEKGGCGRTTITFLLAIELLAQNFAVLTINLAAEESLFWEKCFSPNKRELTTIRDITRQQLQQVLQSEQDNFDYIIINFPREIDPVHLALTDLVIIPFVCSAVDLWALPKSLAKIENAQQINPKLKFVILHNLYTLDLHSKNIETILGQEFKAPIFHAKIGKRNYFNELIAGRKPLPVDDYQALSELSALGVEVIAKLNEQPPAAPKTKEKHVKLSITISQNDANFLEDLRSRIINAPHSFYPTRSDLFRAAVEHLKRMRKEDIADLVKNFKELK